MESAPVKVKGKGFIEDIGTLILESQCLSRDLLPVLRLYPKLQRQIALSVLKRACGHRSMCTLFRLQIHQGDATIWQTNHDGLTRVSELIAASRKQNWKKAIESSPIKSAILARLDAEPIGFATLGELVSDEEWNASEMGRFAISLAKLAGNVLHLEYAWIQISQSELWAFGLRSFGEPKKELETRRATAQTFVESLFHHRECWHAPAANLFSNSAQRVLWVKGRALNDLEGEIPSRERIARYIDLDARVYNRGSSQHGAVRIDKNNVDSAFTEMANVLGCGQAQIMATVEELNAKGQAWYGPSRRELVLKADGELEELVRRGILLRRAKDRPVLT